MDYKAAIQTAKRCANALNETWYVYSIRDENEVTYIVHPFHNTPTVGAVLQKEVTAQK